MSSQATHINATKSAVRDFLPPNRSIFWVTLVSFALIAPALFWGIPSNKDLHHHFRLALPFYEALSNGHFYPGWLAQSNSGYGDASFRFYPPGLYYFLALTRTITGNWYSGSLLAIGCLFAIGSLGIYVWAREYVSSRSAMWAGILYAFAPYHINQIYQAFLFAEFAAAAILPFVFAFAARVCARRRPADIAGLAASYGLLVLTHVPLTVIGSLALAIYVLTSLKPKERLRTLLCFALSLSLGLAASACYWITMVSELSWVRADNIRPDPSVYYGYNFLLSTFSSDNPSVWWVNILLLSTVAMFWPGFAMFKNKSPRATINKRAVLLLLLMTVFMATPLSRPLWTLIRPLQQTQFPWRWMALTSMAAPIVFALAIPFWTRMWREGKRPVLLIAAGTIAMSIAFSAAHTIGEAAYLDKSEFASTLSSLPGSEGVSQWWPVWVKEPLEPMNTAVDARDRMVSIKSWEPERRVFAIDSGEAGEARARTFYYPHWVATSNGKLLATRPAEDGALLISLPAEAGTVELVFHEPVRTNVSAIVSAVGWTFIGLLLIFGWFNRTSHEHTLSNSKRDQSPT